MHWIFNECVYKYKNFVLFITEYPNVQLLFRLIQILLHVQSDECRYSLIYIGVGVHFYVKFVIRHSVKRAIS